MNFITEGTHIYQKDDSGKVIAEIDFPETAQGQFVITHTFVDDSLRGQGVAGKLVAAAVEEITARGGQVGATCSYAVRWLEKNA